MYLECKKCNSDNIEITSPYDNYPFYCNNCKKYLGFEDVKEYVALSTHYSNCSLVHLMIPLEEKEKK